MPGNASTKHSKKNMSQPISATMNPTDELMKVRGTADKLVRPSCGKAIARAVPGAQLTLIDGMAHDLPAALLDRISGIILANFARARAA